MELKFKLSGKYKNLNLAISRTIAKAEALSPINAMRIADMIQNIESEEKLVEFLCTPMTFYYEPGSEPVDTTLKKVIKDFGIILTERMHLPHVAQFDGKGVLSNKHLMMLPMYIWATQQISRKEGASAKTDEVRNIAGQASGESKKGSFTDAEVAVAIAQNADAVMREALGPGSHDLVAKRELKAEIYKTGDASLKNVSNDSKNKIGLIYLNEVLKVLGIDTDLVETPVNK